jgi:hypothetical protein
VLAKQRDAVDADLFAEQLKTTQHIKREKADVVWREHQARERIKQLEIESFVRLKNERSRWAEEMLDRERSLGDSFLEAKTVLEKDLNAQSGKLKEQFGDLSNEVTSYITDNKL